MAGKQSWAEKRWWRGTVFDWMGVLLLLALVFLLSFVSVPFLLLRHTVSSGLQDYYLTVYRSTCCTGSAAPRRCRRAAVQRHSQARLRRRRGRAAASAERSLRLTLSKAASPAGPKAGSSCVSASADGSACAELSRQIQANALPTRRGIPWRMLVL